LHMLQKTTLPSSDQQMDDIDLFDIWERLLKRWRLIACVTAAITILAIAAALTATPIYEAKVVMLVSADESNSKLQGLSGIASQLGLGALGLGAGESNHKAESLATVQSRILTEGYIRDKNLLAILFDKDWDAARKQWKNPQKPRTLWDGNKLFERSIRTVVEDRKTGLVTLTITWKDKELVAQWANDLVARTNAHVRQRALDLSAGNLAYLNEELKSTNVVETQQAIYKLIEGEIKTTMLARGNEQYAFTVIDPAVVPQDKSNLRRLYVVVIGFFAGLTIGVLWALLGHWLSERWKARAGS
jgi:uncharacterized protein involved in exopolysaccharide biosynthesis